MRGGLVVRITPADVGRRVSVRSRIQGEAASTTDTVGHLRAWDDEALQIERKDGSTATIRTADLLAGKVLADEPPRDRRSRATT